VHEPQVGPVDRVGYVQIVGGQHALGEQPLAHQTVLRHRKAMMLGQRQHEGVGVERVQDAKV
jgi:hypothetical protein